MRLSSLDNALNVARLEVLNKEVLVLELIFQVFWGISSLILDIDLVLTGIAYVSLEV